MTTGALNWQSQAPLFFAAEIDTYVPGAAALVVSQGHGTTPRGTLAPFSTPVASSYTIKVSDLGYRTAPADGPVVAYPPYLDTAFAINRQLQLDPLGSAVSETWGSVVLLNPDRQWDDISATNNTDTRTVRILAGRKTLTTDGRRVLLDPPYSALMPLFSGLATNWTLNETNLTVPLRDPAYWLTVPIQTKTYGGTGGLDGTPAMQGTPKPKTRGGTAAAPVCNVTPVLVDPAYLIYQYTDAPGTVVKLYEGGDGTNITPAGDVANLYSGTTPPGQYRTCNALGLFQLGSNPASGRVITVDVTGAFTVAGALSNPVLIAQAVMQEDAAMPAAYIDSAAFAAVAAAGTWIGGIYVSGQNSPTGEQVVSTLLGAIGARLIPSRAGLCRPFLLQALPANATPAATFTPDNTVSLTRGVLPDTLDPPPAAWRVGYAHNYTIQTSSLSPNCPAARTAYLALSDTYAQSASTAILQAYRSPNYPNPLAGALCDQPSAQAVANAMLALWSTRRRVYAVEVPLALGLSVDLGQCVMLQWPVEDLTSGKLGQIVGEAVRSSDNTMTFQVLV